MNDPESAFRDLTRGPFGYHEVIRMLVEAMHAEIAAGNFRTAHDTLQRLKHAARDKLLYGDLERAMIHLECARAYFKLGMRPQSLEVIKPAIHLLEGTPSAAREAEKHALGVAHWMLGTLLPDRARVAAWQQGLEIFTTLHCYYQWDPIQHWNLPVIQWYRARMADMNGMLRSAISVPPMPSPTPPPVMPSPAVTLHPGPHVCLNVVVTIPGDGFRTAPLDELSRELLPLTPAMSQFSLAGRIYRLYNLVQPGAEITLNDGWKYLIWKAPDDSMDQAGIAGNDYVLLRRRQTADSNDIVAVQIEEEAAAVTLRALTLRADGAAELRPHSANPVYQPVEFSAFQAGFTVHGVALGVFK